MVAEPMITIKKADGTFVKVPLSEFKRNKNVPKEPEKTSPVQPVRTPTHHQPVRHPAAHHAAKQHPIHIKEQKKEHHPSPHHPKPMLRADAGSPLEEKLFVKPPSLVRAVAPEGKPAPLLSPKREKQVEEVLKKIGFSVAPEVLGRLKSLILSKLKDVKSEEETRELLARSIKNGGLGLTEQQVEKIIKACQEVDSSENMDELSTPALKGLAGDMALMVEPSELPALPNSVAPMPYNNIKPDFTPSQNNLSKPPAVNNLPKTSPVSAIENDIFSKLPSLNSAGQDDISALIKKNSGTEPAFKLDTRPAMKRPMQDVTASNLEMGPVEEIKSINLTDFRRLSGSSDEAAKRLQQKMFNLQEEAFVWYLEALAAYHTSPLYSEYMQAVCESLADRKSLANVLSIKNGIKLNEVVSLIEMEKGL